MTDKETRWLSDDEQQLWRRWLLVGSRVQAALAREMQQDNGISISDYEVLVNLSESPDRRMRIAALADRLQWDRSRLSHQIARMRERGLVLRESCRDDRRGAFIILTDDGLDATKAAAPGHVEAVRRLFIDQIPAEDLPRFSATLATLAEQFEADCPGA